VSKHRRADFDDFALARGLRSDSAAVGEGRQGCFCRSSRRSQQAFTLLEVMIAVAFIGVAMLALLSLHHSGMQTVARARQLTQAAMLAQALMTDAEQSRFPDPGQLSGDFEKMYPGQYANFRWHRMVEQSAESPDIRRVRITVSYGPGFHRTFVLSEFMHNPLPQLGLVGGASPQQGTPSPPGGGNQ
jgi:general secretion pathway protein I